MPAAGSVGGPAPPRPPTHPAGWLLLREGALHGQISAACLPHHNPVPQLSSSSSLAVVGCPSSPLLPSLLPGRLSTAEVIQSSSSFCALAARYTWAGRLPRGGPPARYTMLASPEKVPRSPGAKVLFRFFLLPPAQALLSSLFTPSDQCSFGSPAE